MIDRATFHIKEDDLLSALWYPDGSGATQGFVGIDGIHDDWEIVDLMKLGTGLVRIDLVRRELDDVQD